MNRSAGERTAGAVRAELARRRISGRTLAEKLGWSVGATARRLRGECPFDIDELVAVADFLSVPLVDLLPNEMAA